MLLFDALIMMHLIGDWILQTEHEAMNKMKGEFINHALLSHCLVYTACFVPVFLYFHVALSWLLLIFSSHMFLDRRWPVIWWLKHVKRVSDETIIALPWLVIAVDQVMHVLIIAFIVVMS